MIAAAGLNKKASYRVTEVKDILGISERSAYYLISRYEANPETGEPKHSNSLQSVKIGHRRVNYDELAAFLARNNTYEKNNRQTLNH